MCSFPSTGYSAQRHPAHPVSVPIRHARERQRLCRHKLRDRFMHRNDYNQIPHTYGVLMHVVSGCFLGHGGALGIFKSSVCTCIQLWAPVRFTLFVIFLFPERAQRMPPAERSALYGTSHHVPHAYKVRPCHMSHTRC